MRQHPWLGVLLICAVAISFAANSALASISYREGSDPLSVLVARTTTAVVVLFLVLQARGVSLRLGPRRRAAGLGLGALLALYSYGLLGSIAHMPVALTIITFYTYPLLTAAAYWIIGTERVRGATVVAILVAFLGLWLALDVKGGLVSVPGVALAVMAAMVFTLVLVLSDKVRGVGDSRPLTLHMLATGSGIFLLISLASGHFVVPDSGVGKLAFAGAPLFYTFSIITLFVAIRMVGPVRTALVMNVEPIASTVFGYLLLAQTLRPVQLFGMVLVLIALILSQRRTAGATTDANAV